MVWVLTKHLKVKHLPALASSSGWPCPLPSRLLPRNQGFQARSPKVLTGAVCHQIHHLNMSHLSALDLRGP